MPPTTNSDSEDDVDYVPPADDNDSDSLDEQDGVVATTVTAPELDSAEQKKRRDALWASFQASVSTPPSDNTASLSSSVKRIKIEKTYLFAGKHVRDVIEVPEDSEEAKRWPRWSPSRVTSNSGPTSTACSEAGKEESKGNSPVPPSAPATVSLSSIAATPGPMRTGSRKPRTSLPSIPKGSQVKKITTLDKSAMDWRTHVAQSSDVKDELDANRRTGGYLEKVDFLKRVQDRKEDALEASKLSKRRKT